MSVTSTVTTSVRGDLSTREPWSEGRLGELRVGHRRSIGRVHEGDGHICVDCESWWPSFDNHDCRQNINTERRELAHKSAECRDRQLGCHRYRGSRSCRR